MQKGGGGEGDRDVRRKGAHTFVCAHAQIREVMDADAGAVYICMKTHTHTYACMQIHYVYMYICTHTRTHTHAHTHTHTDHGGYGYGRRSCISQTRTLLSADPWYEHIL